MIAGAEIRPGPIAPATPSPVRRTLGPVDGDAHDERTPLPRARPIAER